jgi:uncharacterized protein (TIGR00255 family)
MNPAVETERVASKATAAHAEENLGAVAGKAKVYSMTGYAGSTSAVVLPQMGETRVLLALKSVNHRFLDVQLRLPAGYDALEMEIRRILKEEFVRGHIEFGLTLDRSSQRGFTLNKTALAACVEAFRSAAREHALDAQPDLNVLLRLPGVLQQEMVASEEDQKALAEFVVEETKCLIPKLKAMREREGQELARLLQRAMLEMEATVHSLVQLHPEIAARHEQRLQQKITTLIGGEVNRQRLLEEVALLADRSDVSEELERLHTHIQHFCELLEQGGEVGKKLDFLLQELNREANTLLSKTTGIAGKGTEVTELGLALKSNIEKAREQIQNLE